MIFKGPFQYKPFFDALHIPLSRAKKPKSFWVEEILCLALAANMLFLIHTCFTTTIKKKKKNPTWRTGIILQKHFLEVCRSHCPSPWVLFQFNSSEIRRITLSPFFNYKWSHSLHPSKTLLAQALQETNLRASHSFVIMVLFQDIGDRPSGGKRDPNSDLSNSRWVFFSLPSEM